MLQEILNQVKHSNLTDKAEVKKEVMDFLTRMYNSRKKKGLKTEQTELEHIADYLLATEKTKLRKTSFKQAKEGAIKWQKSLVKKARDIIETEEDTEVIKDFKDGMKLVRLVGKAAFDREGKIMRHCVGSYYRESGMDDILIYSLRDANNSPHCTLEITKNGKEVNQIKGKGNGPIHPNYIKYIVQVLEKVFKLKVRDSEMENLGYLHITGEALQFLEENIENLKFITLRNKNYYYLNSIRVKSW